MIPFVNVSFYHIHSLSFVPYFIFSFERKKIAQWRALNLTPYLRFDRMKRKYVHSVATVPRKIKYEINTLHNISKHSFALTPFVRFPLPIFGWINEKYYNGPNNSSFNEIFATVLSFFYSKSMKKVRLPVMFLLWIHNSLFHCKLWRKKVNSENVFDANGALTFIFAHPCSVLKCYWCAFCTHQTVYARWTLKKNV